MLNDMITTDMFHPMTFHPGHIVHPFITHIQSDRPLVTTKAHMQPKARAKVVAQKVVELGRRTQIINPTK